MNRTKIEWVKNEDGTQGYTINPVKGLCPMHCKTPEGYEYCYAAGERGLYKRFKWNPEIRYEYDIWRELCVERPLRVFVGSTMELFGKWIRDEWLEDLFGMTKQFPQHTFIFLTKQPQNLAKWSPFPPNTNVGVSVTNQAMHNEAIACLSGIKASIKIISYEPLLSKIIIEGAYDLSEIQWVIIGSQTQPLCSPKREWVDGIVKACDKVSTPVFLKYNLVGGIPIKEPFYKHTEEGWAIRQEFPRVYWR